MDLHGLKELLPLPIVARYFQLAMFLALLMALFLPDLWVILNQADNSVLDVLLTLVGPNVGNVGNIRETVPVFSKTMSKTNSVGKQLGTTIIT